MYESEEVFRECRQTVVLKEQLLNRYSPLDRRQVLELVVSDLERVKEGHLVAEEVVGKRGELIVAGEQRTELAAAREPVRKTLELVIADVHVFQTQGWMCQGQALQPFKKYTLNDALATNGVVLTVVSGDDGSQVFSVEGEVHYGVPRTLQDLQLFDSAQVQIFDAVFAYVKFC
jgi:hypothetical protein